MVDPFQQCPFKVLKLPVTATEDEITRKWKQLILKNHPDKNPGEHAKENTQVLNDAKDRALKHAQDAREYRNRLLKEEERKKRKQEEERKQKEYNDKKMKQWEDKVQKEVDEIIKNAFDADRIRREKEETRKRKQEEDERLHKEKEETRKREEEETRKHKQEELDERMLREKEETKKREECTRVVETIWPFLVYGMDNVNDRTHLIYHMIQGRKKEHIDTKRAGRTFSPFYASAAMYDMAEEINKHSIEVRNAKNNTERLESALVEAKKELEAERILKNDLAKRMSEAATLLDNERNISKNDLAKRMSEAATRLDNERNISKNDLAQHMAEAATLLDNERIILKK